MELEQRFVRLETRVAASPWFDGDSFSLVDAVFGPVFRYFDVFDDIADFGILTGKPKLAQWRKALAARPSVRSAVSADYPALLHAFIARRNSWLSGLQSRGGGLIGAQDSAAICASFATVFMLRAVPVLAAAMTSFDWAMPSP